MGRPSNAEKRQVSEKQTEIQRLVELYENGASDVEVCADLKYPWREFEKRLNNDDAFKQLVEYGRLAAKAWFLRQGRLGVKDKSMNFPVWFAMMKNRYGWSDKVDMNNTESKPMDQMSNEELEQAMTDRLKKAKGKVSALFAIKNVEVEDSDGSGKVH